MENQNTLCREKARDYFKCRMDKGLMDHEEWNRLGYADMADGQQAGDAKSKQTMRPMGRGEGTNDRQYEIVDIRRGGN
jgi:hypothetical protein